MANVNPWPRVRVIVQSGNGSGDALVIDNGSRVSAGRAVWERFLETRCIVRRLGTRKARGVVLKIRGWLDGLRDLAPPFEALGLR